MHLKVPMGGSMDHGDSPGTSPISVAHIYIVNYFV